MVGAPLLLALLSVACAWAGARAGLATRVHSGLEGPLFECASQIHELYRGPHYYSLAEDYDKNTPPNINTTVWISLFINRVSAVEENKEEITLDVFLQVYWEDRRLHTNSSYVELPWEHRQFVWMPDLYIKQLQEMRILSVFQEMTSMRLYGNGTVRVSIGATIIIKCDMDFVLYPLDVQRCDVDFSSYKYTAQNVTFEWRQASADWSDSEGRKEFRLPKYVVKFKTDTSKQIIHFGEGEHSSARLRITLSRELRSYLLESYLPSSLFVIMSWGSFCVIPEIVPGRMVLLVTTLLSLVTMFDTVRNNSPDALELKCIEVWLISCTIFVFLALLEYFIVLFGIRYDKSWRTKPRQPHPTPTNVISNHAPKRVFQQASRPASAGGTPGSGGGGSVFAARVVPEDDAFKQQINAQTIQRDSPMMESYQPNAELPSGGVARVKALVQRAVLFCGAQKGTLDLYALMLFPMSFFLFAAIYWTTYVNESNKRLELDNNRS